VRDIRLSPDRGASRCPLELSTSTRELKRNRVWPSPAGVVLLEHEAGGRRARRIEGWRTASRVALRFDFATRGGRVRLGKQVAPRNCRYSSASVKRHRVAGDGTRQRGSSRDNDVPSRPCDARGQGEHLAPRNTASPIRFVPELTPEIRPASGAHYECTGKRSGSASASSATSISSKRMQASVGASIPTHDSPRFHDGGPADKAEIGGYSADRRCQAPRRRRENPWRMLQCRLVGNRRDPSCSRRLDVPHAEQVSNCRVGARFRQHALARIHQDHRRVAWRRGDHVAGVLLVSGSVGMMNLRRGVRNSGRRRRW